MYEIKTYENLEELREENEELVERLLEEFAEGEWRTCAVDKKVDKSRKK